MQCRLPALATACCTEYQLHVLMADSRIPMRLCLGSWPEPRAAVLVAPWPHAEDGGALTFAAASGGALAALAAALSLTDPEKRWDSLSATGRTMLANTGNERMAQNQS